LEKNADLIKAVMAQRKKKPKPVPAIAGGEVVVDIPAVVENGTKGSQELATTLNEGVTLIHPQSTTNGHEQAITLEATDVEISGITRKDTASSTHAIRSNQEVSTIAQPESSSAKEIVDQKTVMDTDNTDSAQVEDTI
jgi:hypothetical protein